ncbi:MAG: protein-disulfide reductase DsbD family protein [Bryobacterales bacterium]|nr:protein-disulfide reductase DsbD family protein [Bryobacterales bacterium]
MKLTTWASDAALRGGNRFALVVDVDLNQKMHVYSPEVEGYIPIDWRMEEAAGVTVYDAEYPESKSLHLPAIDETVPVYEGSFRLVRDVMIGQDRQLGDLLKDGKLTIRGSLRYQACDDKMCYLPTSVPLEWTVDFEQHDRQRVSEDLRR